MAAQNRRSLLRGTKVNYTEEDSESGVSSVSSDVSSSELESSEEDYVPSKSARRNQRKPAKLSKMSSAKYYKYLEENLEENGLFQALQDPDNSIIELANDWLDHYTSSQDEAIRDLVNLILRSCGCLSLVEAHDVFNLETAQKTVEEIGTKFRKQQSHEFPYGSNSKTFKNFDKTLLEFFRKIIMLGSDKNMLVSEEEEDQEKYEEKEEDDSDDDTNSGLLETIFVWALLLLASPIRPARIVATLVLLTVETALCECVVRFTKSVAKSHKSLRSAITKKERIMEKLDLDDLLSKEQAKLSRDLKRAELQVESTQKNLDYYDTQRSILKDYLRDSFSSVFLHRLRDVDSKIRVECVKHLFSWIDIYPEFFFDTTYLNHLGKLFHDPTNLVKCEVLKGLARLYRKSTSVVSGLKQFTERFKTSVIDTLLSDADNSVKSGCLTLLVEINRVGFLEQYEILKISSLIFTIIRKDSEIVLLEKANVPEYARDLKEDDKLLMELAKFVNHVESEYSQETLLRYKDVQDFFLEKNGLDLRGIVKFKSLVQILAMAKGYHQKKTEENGNTSEEEDDPDEAMKHFKLPKTVMETANVFLVKLEPALNVFFSSFRKSFSEIYLNEIARFGRILYQGFAPYHFLWQFLLQYLTSDLSSLETPTLDLQSDDEFQNLLQLSGPEQYVLLSLLYGILEGAVSEAPLNYHVDDPTRRLTKREAALKARRATDQDELVVSKDANTNARHALVTLLPSLVTSFDTSAPCLRIILCLFIDLATNLSDSKKPLFVDAAPGDEIVHFQLVQKLVLIYKNLHNRDEFDLLQPQFSKFFYVLLTGFDSSVLPLELKIQVQNLAIESYLGLLKKAREEHTNPNILILAYEMLRELHVSAEKFRTLGQSFNVAEYVNDQLITNIGEQVFRPITHFTNAEAVELTLEHLDLELRDAELSAFCDDFEVILRLYINLTSWRVLQVAEFARNDETAIFGTFEGAKTGGSFLDFFSASSLMFTQLKNFTIGGQELNEWLLNMRCSTAEALADMLVQFQVLKTTTLGSEKLNQYFGDYDTYLETQMELKLNEALQSAFLTIFLHLESNLARFLGVQLDRLDNEDVNYGLVKPRSDMLESEKRKAILIHEEKLAVYARKMMGLGKLEIISEDFMKRLSLNCQELGSLYMGALEDDQVPEEANEKVDNEEVEKPVPESRVSLGSKRKSDVDPNADFEEISETESGDRGSKRQKVSEGPESAKEKFIRQMALMRQKGGNGNETTS